MALRARDVMQTSVLSVEPSAPLIEVARLFLEEEIHGAPVVDETEQLLGVVSVTDLLRAVGEEHESAGSSAVYFRDVLEFSGPDWTSAPQDFQDRLGQRTVGEVMQPGVVTVAAEATVPEIAKRMRAQRIHRVIVVDGEGRMVGLITALDLVGLLEA